MKVILTVIQGPEKGRKFEFDKPDRFLVGRSQQAHFQLTQADGFISRQHFILEIRPPLCHLKDLQSTNHTYVNEKEVTEAELHEGDRIKIGKTVLEVAIETVKEEPQRIYCAYCQRDLKAKKLRI